MLKSRDTIYGVGCMQHKVQYYRTMNKDGPQYGDGQSPASSNKEQAWVARNISKRTTTRQPCPGGERRGYEKGSAGSPAQKKHHPSHVVFTSEAFFACFNLGLVDVGQAGTRRAVNQGQPRAVPATLKKTKLPSPPRSHHRLPTNCSSWASPCPS